MQNVKRAIACIFILVGGFGLPVALLSLYNPFGAKLYNLDDPLGTPVSTGEVFLTTVVYVVMLVIGIWLAVSGRRQQEAGSTDDEVD